MYRGNMEKISGRFCFGVLKAVVFAWIIIFLMSVLCAICVNRECLAFENLSICLVLTTFSSSLTASFIAGKAVHSNGTLASIASVCVSFIIQMAIGILCFEGLSDSVWLGMAFTTAGCVVGIFMQRKRSNNRNRYRKVSRCR